MTSSFVLGLSSCSTDSQTDDLQTTATHKPIVDDAIPNGGAFYHVADGAARKMNSVDSQERFTEIVARKSDTIINGLTFSKILIEENGKTYLDHFISKNEKQLIKYQVTSDGSLVHVPLLSAEPFLNETLDGDQFSENLFMQSTLYRLDSLHINNEQSGSTYVTYTAFVKIQAIDSEYEEVLSSDTIVFERAGGPMIYSFEGDRFQHVDNAIQYLNFE